MDVIRLKRVMLGTMTYKLEMKQDGYNTFFFRSMAYNISSERVWRVDYKYGRICEF